MIILGIETSCDDTGVGIVEDGVKILSNVISSQDSAHKPFGGIVPEIAARMHVEAIGFMVEKALEQANLTYGDIDAIAVTARHGLLRSLVVGVAAAKSLALALDIPLIGVHHIEGHIYSNLIEHGDKLTFPHVCLTVSGGHTLLLNVVGTDEYHLIGRTYDDAAGEVFDKVSKVLGLGFPGGPIIDKTAAQGRPDRFAFPRPMIDRDNYDFSFSGLKTAVINEINALRRAGQELPVADLCASFQQAAVDVLVDKTFRAAQSMGLSTVSVCGGVAANSGLRKAFQTLGDQHGISAFYPRMSLCTDNGAMIAGLGYYKFMKGLTSDLRLDAEANAPLGLMQVKY